MFIFEREGERDRVWAGEEQREKETQNLKQAPGSELSAQSPVAGLELTDREIMTWAEVGCSTDWAAQVPRLFSVFKSLLWFASLSAWNYFSPFPHGLLLSFLNSTYEWKHMLSVFLCLAYITY